MTTEARRVAALEGSGTFGTTEFVLYALTVVTWSTSWILIKFQVGPVSIWQSVLYRFSIAVVVMFAWVVLSGRRIRFPAALHPRLMLMGALMFSMNFALFYLAAQWLTSGLLAVVFSVVTILNPINAAIVLRDRLEPRVLVGALIGVTGIALIFWPEVNRPETGNTALFGLAAAGAGAMCFSLGNMVASGVHRRGYPVISANAWASLYGVVLLAGIVAGIGAPLKFDPDPSYVVPLVLLATVSTVVPMASYLTLMRRIGPGRAGYATVMFPIGALVISWLFEGYEWTMVALAGLALALLGNLFVLRKPRSR
ncbi:DMT family transporter [Microbaculum marinisediminis]|uniref:DMT family transporter n=1 Tax=Microbaculum marinisediminis TaxID=2931392 RepID=A0AAW5QVP0_9HYPH|nr:DMT family transporter [Microbaculum sp. A6E488]MCT8970369.1 DMT family transporter [Microbaculum sp. A6E488]